MQVWKSHMQMLLVLTCPMFYSSILSDLSILLLDYPRLITDHFGVELHLLLSTCFTPNSSEAEPIFVSCGVRFNSCFWRWCQSQFWPPPEVRLWIGVPLGMVSTMFAIHLESIFSATLKMSVSFFQLQSCVKCPFFNLSRVHIQYYRR